MHTREMPRGEIVVSKWRERQWSDCLSQRNGHLFIDDCKAADLVQQHGSPLFVLSEKQLRANVREFQESFQKYWPHGPVDILPAFKANWTLATRAILSEEGAGADIYSEGELAGALKCNTRPELISVNGGGKSEEMIRRCIQAGVRITVEDLDEPERINRIAGELGLKARVRFRVKPDFPNLHKRTDFSQEYASIDLGIQVYKSGIPAQYLPELGKRVLSMPNIELIGFHFHGGRHHQSLWFWRGMMKQYAKLIANLCEHWGSDGKPFKPREIDVGGGFASYRDPHNKLEYTGEIIFTWLTWPFVKLMRFVGSRLRYRIYDMILQSMARDPYRGYAPTVDEYAEATVGTLRSELERRKMDLDGVRLQVEPGRRLYGNAGIHLSTIKKVKKQTVPLKMNWVLTDTTYFFLTGGVYEYNFHDFVIANRTDAEPTQVADIVGHSCYGDRILPLVNVPEVSEGDILAILETGAYQEASASNFNALPRPATVLVNGSFSEVIKRAETIDDVYGRDIVPARLIAFENRTDQRSASPNSASGGKG